MEQQHTQELIKRLRHIARLDAESYGAIPEDSAEWEAADLIEELTKQRDNLLAACETYMTYGVGEATYYAIRDAIISVKCGAA